MTVGRAATNDVVLEDDLVSRLHAVFEAFRSQWSVRDLGSSNGTIVNGERLWVSRVLQSGDQIGIGQTRLVYRTAAGASEIPTRGPARRVSTDLTRREREILAALCKPLLSGGPVREPATTREIARALVITEAAVRQHLLNLYRKFDIEENAERRRSMLAREAMRLGLVGPRTSGH